MLETTRAHRGMVTSPHHLASRAGCRVLEEGGNAIEAAIAAAATIAVVYPHMNGLGGDNFWLIDDRSGAPFGIDASGPAARGIRIDDYRARRLTAIPPRGPLAALTVAGAVAGWSEALGVSRERWGGQLPLERLLADAIHYARDGFAVTATQHDNTQSKREQLEAIDGFSAAFLEAGRAWPVGARFRQPALAAALEQLARAGLADFYRGDLARSIASDLAAAGSPVTLADLEAYTARRVSPLAVKVGPHEVFNLPPPTQGLASLLLLAIYARLGVGEAEGFAFVHGLVEATKRAFRIRDRFITDPAYMRVAPRDFLADAALDASAAAIDRACAAPWPAPADGGDTVWLAACDGLGRMVSFIQSLYWEFGSGVVLPHSGITWQNRGISFSLDPTALNALASGRRPFHTIQPALARLADGRVLAYGAMGGEGQPQTQAAIFARHVLHGAPLQQAVTAPRWLLGRTWGEATTNLKIEDRFDGAVIEALRFAGHALEIVAPFSQLMGHAGAIACHPHGLMEGACDPRSDGAVAAF